MDKEKIFNIISAIIEEVTDISKDELHLEDSFLDDIDLSSLEVMAVVSKLSKKMSVSIKEKELIQIETIEDLVNLIESKI